jgi:hypothetical protein
MRSRCTAGTGSGDAAGISGESTATGPPETSDRTGVRRFRPGAGSKEIGDPVSASSAQPVPPAPLVAPVPPSAPLPPAPVPPVAPAPPSPVPPVPVSAPASVEADAPGARTPDREPQADRSNPSATEIRRMTARSEASGVPLTLPSDRGRSRAWRMCQLGHACRSGMLRRSRAQRLRCKTAPGGGQRAPTWSCDRPRVRFGRWLSAAHSLI